MCQGLECTNCCSGRTRRLRAHGVRRRKTAEVLAQHPEACSPRCHLPGEYPSGCM